MYLQKARGVHQQQHVLQDRMRCAIPTGKFFNLRKMCQQKKYKLKLKIKTQAATDRLINQLFLDIKSAVLQKCCVRVRVCVREYVYVCVRVCVCVCTFVCVCIFVFCVE